MAEHGKEAVWQQRLRRYQRSGLTVVEFCNSEGVSVPSFYQWRKRLAPAPPRKAQTPAFQQLTLGAPSAVVAIELPSGVRVEVPVQHVQLVRTVMADLLQAEAGRIRGDAGC